MLCDAHLRLQIGVGECHAYLTFGSVNANILAVNKIMYQETLQSAFLCAFVGKNKANK